MIRVLSGPTPSSEDNEVRIVLSMIVRNEGAVVRRCLESALPHVDAFVVCDTGSTDNTIRSIEQTARQYGLPGSVVRHPWRNFGHNRTLAAREAATWVAHAGWPAGRTYLLFLDADMVLHVDPHFDKRALTATSYDVIQDNGTLRYSNTRLACLSHEWISVGSTHEYWAPAGEAPITSARLEAMHIEDVGDGGSKARKFNRDISLLRQDLARDPRNPRHTFYLAQSYFDLGRWTEAAAWYQRRWKMGGWDEERWFAHYRHGLCMLHLGDGHRAVGVLLEAFDERPARAEPLWAIAQHFRNCSKNNLALMFALRALELPFPGDDVLFVEKQVYEWQLWEEVMISAYYVGDHHHDLGLSACERLLARRGHDASFYNYVLSNEAFYVPTLKVTRRGTFAIPRSAREHDGMEYHAANPTIAHWRGRTHVNVRLLNYRHTAGLNYTSMASDGVFRTYNATLPWDPATGHAGAVRISRDIPEHWASNTWGQGLEDVRWVVHQDQLWLTAVCYQVPGDEGRCRVVLGRMNQRLDAVEHLVALSYSDARAVEKNWLLWSHGGELRLIYSYDPLVILRVDTQTGETQRIRESNPPFRAASFRGSCAPVRIPGRIGRWIALVHEVAERPSGRVYTHRWIELDEQAGLVSYSRPFVFDHVGVEYATGLCDLDGHKLMVTYGFEDHDARWAECRWADVIASLRAGESEARTEPPRSIHSRFDDPGPAGNWFAEPQQATAGASA
jgi:glycosyltransferase involved in cell wall biosynthesis